MKLTKKEAAALVQIIVDAKVKARSEAVKFDALPDARKEAGKFDFIWSQAQAMALEWLLLDLARAVDTPSAWAANREVAHAVNAQLAAIQEATEQARAAAAEQVELLEDLGVDAYLDRCHMAR